MSRTIHHSREVLEMIDIHVFGDADLLGTCAVAYAVIQQPSGTKQRLIASKPRLELVAAQMEANLANNIRKSLKNYNIREVYVMVRSHGSFTLVTRKWKLQAIRS